MVWVVCCRTAAGLQELTMGGFLRLLKKSGMQVTELPAAEVARLREKMKPVIAKHSASVGEATVQAMMSELDKLRK